MPELPEVETVRRGLAGAVAGREVRAVHVLHPRAVRRHLAGPRDFTMRLVGSRLDVPRRRGKYLWLPLSHEGAPSDEALVAHLGMSGQFRTFGREATVDVGPHVRARIQLDDGSEVQFVDQRTFGGLALEQLTSDGIPMGVAHIALDPFDPNYEVGDAVARLRRRRTEVKRALLDQTVVSGIGNIYADEALWRARMHPARPTKRITRAQGTELLTLADVVMRDSLAAGGTSFDELYVNVNGESGYFERSLDVYGREGEPCPRCGTAIRRVSFMNRSSFFCPRCQRTPRRTTRPASP